MTRIRDNIEEEASVVDSDCIDRVVGQGSREKQVWDMRRGILRPKAF